MRGRQIYIFLIMVCLLGGSTDRSCAEVEISNLVLNKTITKLGDDFYEAFAKSWAPPANLDLSYIKIGEAPSARWGSLLYITVNDKVLFRTNVSTRSRNVDEIARQAAQNILIQLIREEMYKHQQEGASDLAGDGL